MGEAVDVTSAYFAARMERFAPFEAEPVLAVGVSGGADSIALCLLAAQWTQANGGRVVALTVDHALRPEAALEARQVSSWLAEKGIAHRTLRITAPPPHGDIQAWARTHRYALLEAWCRSEGCLHLLLAHHRDDQAETLLLRLARGSGAIGLSGMADRVSRPWGCVLRPLLDTPPEALRRYLKAKDQAWIEDPSNRSPRFARARMRALLPVFAAEGADSIRLAKTAMALRRTRDYLEGEVDTLLARSVWVHPLGYAVIESGLLRAASAEIAEKALSWVVQGIGGRPYPPRYEKLVAGLARIGLGPITLGGCRLSLRADGKVLVTRERRALPRTTLLPGEETLWDGRYRIALSEGERALDIAPLDVAGWASLRNLKSEKKAWRNHEAVPSSVVSTLPAFWREGTLLGVPALNLWVCEPPKTIGPVFAPRHPVGSVRLRLAASQTSIM